MARCPNYGWKESPEFAENTGASLDLTFNVTYVGLGEVQAW